MTAMSCLFFPGPNGREAEARHHTDAVTHVRDTHQRPDGDWATGPWRELETSNA